MLCCVVTEWIVYCTRKLFPATKQLTRIMLWTAPSACTHSCYGIRQIGRAAPGGRLKHIALRAQPTPEEALAAAVRPESQCAIAIYSYPQAAELGLPPERITIASAHDDDDDSWDDVMEEMEDPWMREPAGVHTMGNTTQSHRNTAPLAIDGITDPPSTSPPSHKITDISIQKLQVGISSACIQVQQHCIGAAHAPWRQPRGAGYGR